MSSSWKKTLADGTEVVRTGAWSAPGDHPVGCGLKLFVKDGKLVKVEGDPEHPVTKGRLCVRCLALPEYVNHPDRIIYPMKRDPKDRGKNKWQRISWDEALDLADENIKKIRAKYGYEGTVLFNGTGRIACINSAPAAYNTLQSPHVCYAFSGYSCYGPRIAVTAFVVGAGIPEIDYAGGFPDRYDDPRFEVPKYVLIWGKEPLRSNADGMWGHAVIELMKLGAKLIVVDPRMNWLATRAEYSLQLRPGTDAALALGMLNVIINEDLYDHEFVEKWTVGFDELVERVQEYPVSKVSEITGVPAELIVTAARAVSERPTSFAWGVAVDQNVNGLQIAQSLLIMSAITGNLDTPGGTVLGSLLGVDEEADLTDMTEDMGKVDDVVTSNKSGYQATSLSGAELVQSLSTVSEETMAKKIGREQYPAFDMTVNSVQPDYFLEALEKDEPYPVRFAWYQSSNLLSPTCSAQPERWHKALQKMEYAIATDLFMNPTIMAGADLFLPVATFAEYNSVVAPHYGMHKTFITTINKAIEVGETKSDVEISFLLGKRLNPEGFPMTFEEYLNSNLNQSTSFTGMSWEQLRENGVYQVPAVYKKYEKGLLRADRQPGFNTMTGKFEIACSMYEHFGDDAIPYYEEPHYSPVSKPELKDKYPLILTTGSRTFTSFHSEHRQIKSLRAIDPDPILEINPKTAANLGIEDGNWVNVENMFGKAKLRARITPIIRPDVVNAYHGWWFPEEDGEAPNLFGVWKSNINSLVPSGDNGKIGFGAPFKNMICKVSKAD